MPWVGEHATGESGDVASGGADGAGVIGGGVIEVGQRADDTVEVSAEAGGVVGGWFGPLGAAGFEDAAAAVVEVFEAASGAFAHLGEQVVEGVPLPWRQPRPGEGARVRAG